MASKKEETKPGKIDIGELRKNLNSKLKGTVFDLTKENPTDVVDWIPTGSTWLNGIICKGNQ
jgi:hypothetical protein